MDSTCLEGRDDKEEKKDEDRTSCGHEEADYIAFETNRRVGWSRGKSDRQGGGASTPFACAL